MQLRDAVPVRGAPSIALLLGGFDPPSRRSDSAAGRRPLNDVWMLTESFGAVVRDFGWLDAKVGASRARRLLAWLARRSGQWSAALAVATALEVRKFDAVYISGEDVGVVACAVSRLVPGKSPLFILRVERPVYGRTRWRRSVHRRAMTFASRRIGVAICRTSAIADYLRRNTRVPAEHVLAFGQEIDTAFFDPNAVRGGPVAVAGPFIMSAGLERRDYATLLAAVEGLPITLVIAVGSPWSKDTFDTDRDPPDNVVVGTFDQCQMRELYRRAQVVVLSVLPTDRACGMNVIGEAWAMARPVVASATDGLGEFIVSGDNGLLVPPGDAEAMRTAILEVLSSESLAAGLARSGHEYVWTHLSLDRFCAMVERALDLGGLARP